MFTTRNESNQFDGSQLPRDEFGNQRQAQQSWSRIDQNRGVLPAAHQCADNSRRLWAQRPRPKAVSSIPDIPLMRSIHPMQSMHSRELHQGGAVFFLKSLHQLPLITSHSEHRCDRWQQQTLPLLARGLSLRTRPESRTVHVWMMPTEAEVRYQRRRLSEASSRTPRPLFDESRVIDPSHCLCRSEKWPTFIMKRWIHPLRRH